MTYITKSLLLIITSLIIICPYYIIITSIWLHYSKWQKQIEQWAYCYLFNHLVLLCMFSLLHCDYPLLLLLPIITYYYILLTGEIGDASRLRTEAAALRQWHLAMKPGLSYKSALSYSVFILKMGILLSIISIQWPFIAVFVLQTVHRISSIYFEASSLQHTLTTRDSRVYIYMLN